MEYEELKRLSPHLSQATSFQRMTSGFSGDQTFVVKTRHHEKFVLKLSDPHKHDRLKSKMPLLQSFKEQGILCSEVIDMGVNREYHCFYRVFPYIEGENARESIQTRTDEEQYEIGRRAGRQLRKMHTYAAPPSIAPWDERATEKHERYVHAYQTSGVRFDFDHTALQFITSHIEVIKERPNQFQHDDFHLGNLLINGNQYAGVIDFDQSDWGDPIHDFYKLSLFSSEISIPFAVGQIDGYLSAQPEKEFWLLFSIYTAMSLFSSIVWTMTYDPAHLNDMIERVNRIMKEHQCFHRLEPIWYTNDGRV
ncbi:aminoglycoside phosphotransferase family protein [Bacillus sp. 179-C3.3 HS]|uniref:aminoglycoside phosphotransferase family protein n=1 Tax=Bacillus sp. 179-C3.3 HS TaxID=3232162 RepID=UPI0039A2FAA4